MNLKNKNLFAERSFVNNQLIDARDKISVFNPSDNKLLGKVPNLSEVEVHNAIVKAQSAFEKWRKLAAKERAKILYKWYELILLNQEDLAVILTKEQGKALAEARGEIIYAANFIEWFAEEAKRNYGDVIPAPKANQKIMSLREPVGVVAAITPWNFPAAMITRKAAAAMAVGCSVIVKPSELTPFSAIALAILAKEAGVPEGVFNVISGDAEMIGKEFCASKIIRKISFTGSTKIGKLLYKQCADDLKRLSLELGGSAPFIVFADADLDAAVAGLMQSKFRNAGQTCISTNRIFVAENIHDQFVAKLVSEVKKLKVGDGFKDAVNIGPLISEQAVAKVEKLIADSLKNGAKCALGGKKSFGQFFEPTVMTQIKPDMEIALTEIFGPIAAVQKFKDEHEVIKLANDTEYGLAAYFYTKDDARIWRVSEALEFGMIAINDSVLSTEVAPFGGIKASGFGREGSHLALTDFTHVKTLHWSF